MTNQQRRVIAILRVSTDQQDTARQKRDVATAARAHNLQITRTVELADLSGTKVLGNAEVQKVLADLSRSDIHGVTVSAIDRLIRPGQLGDLQIFDAFQRSRKLIFTPAQVIDINTQAGFLTSGIMGVIAGFERQMILARTAAGREIARQRGGNPCGAVVLPRGVAFSKTSGWSYVEPGASQVRKAYDLLFERRSWHDIADRIGGFTYNGIRESLRNPIWKGIRRYTEGREEPLEIKVIEQALISPERWEAAQRIILEKRTRWAKTKHADPRFLLSGLLQCACGKPVYLRCGSRSMPRHYYRCSSAFPGRGPWCGARSVQSHAADRVVEEIVSTELLDTAFLRTVLSRFQSSQPARDENAGKLARQREKLEAERQRLLRLTLKGTCTEEDFARESKRIESELKDLDRLAPAPVPATFDPAKLIVRITRTFARFHKQPLEERRDLLRTVFREIVLANSTVTAITLNGGFLEGVNSLAPSCWFETRFPQSP
jgi:DNA invertase Pin-like site-specific DNA recombinase